MGLNLDDISEALLRSWILSNDECEGDLWDSLCMTLGYDPDILKVATEQARKRHLRLKCGHYDVDENVYIRFKTRQCRTCAGHGSEKPERQEN